MSAVQIGVAADAAPRRSWVRPLADRLDRRSALVVLMTAAQLALAALAGHGVFGQPPLFASIPLPWWGLAVGFAATEACVLHIQVNREAQTISISELPLVLGLFFASPVQLLVGRLVGTAAILIFYRRSSPLKTAWNLAALSLQSAVAVAVFHLLAEGHPVTHPLTWVAAFAGSLAANSVSSLALELVVSVYEGGLSPVTLARAVVTGEQAALLVITFAVVAVGALTCSPSYALPLCIVVVGMLAGYRAYAGLADRHLNLERLYRFTQAVSSSPEVEQVLGNVLQEARELLHSETAEVLFVASAAGVVARVRLSSSGRLSRAEEPQSPEDEWLLAQVVTEGGPLLAPRATRDAEQRRWLESLAAREALAVPLKGGAGTIGALVVTDRLGDVRTYDADDVLLLETVANHASMALEKGQLIDQLRHEALHDSMTGLPNRVALQRRLSSALDDVADGRSAGAAVMILDLDGFKEVNDTLGHQQGDQLLVEVAARLTTAVDTAGLVTRLGGDEFAILLPATADEDKVVRVGRRVLQALEQAIALDGMEVEVGGSLGIALAPAHATDPAALLKRADLAMYDAKNSSHGLRVYDPHLDTTNPRRLTLVSELRNALQSGQVEVFAQPQARLDGGAVVGAEALVRWRHPEFGVVSPEEFIPIAERSGLIAPLTTHVLDRSLAAVARWRADGRDLGIAVNLSTRSLHDADLVEEVGRLLRRHGVPADRLTLEVTEGSVMADPARATALLHQLRELGVRLSVDDFGTGYSSLSYLKRLPVQEVKIDRSFVTSLCERSDDVAIVRAIVDLGRHLGLEVVAEGVEDQATQDLLASMGCHLVQGWHLGRPMPIGDMIPWLRTREEQALTAARSGAV
jgi:diguanylate cyclase (GGDEF)-like protein